MACGPSPPPGKGSCRWAFRLGVGAGRTLEEAWHVPLDVGVRYRNDFYSLPHSPWALRLLFSASVAGNGARRLFPLLGNQGPGQKAGNHRAEGPAEPDPQP